MALGLLYTRRCEQRFKAYVPKRRLFHYLTGQHVDWGSIDQHDEERGDINEVEQLAALTGSRSVDLSVGEQTTCGNCDLQIDPLRHFHLILTGATTAV